MSEPIIAVAPSWNPVADIGQVLQYAFMRQAFEAGTVVAITAGVVGYFVVVRRASFGAHALSHVGFAGATGAVALGINPVGGLLVFTWAGGAVMGALGRRIIDRDTTIGIVMAWTLGLGVLFASLYNGTANQAYALLFGQILGITPTDVLITAAAGLGVLAAAAALYRPLTFASLEADVAEARGVPVRGLSIAFMVLLATVVSVAVQVVGVLLIFALLVTPAAIAVRLATSPARAMAISVGLALVFVWAGLVVAYYIAYPVSFFITTFAFAGYLLARAGPRCRVNRWRASRAGA